MPEDREKKRNGSFDGALGSVLLWILVAFLLTGLYHMYAAPLGRWIRSSM